jgi:hypothetical protein
MPFLQIKTAIGNPAEVGEIPVQIPQSTSDETQTFAFQLRIFTVAALHPNIQPDFPGRNTLLQNKLKVSIYL